MAQRRLDHPVFGSFMIDDDFLQIGTKQFDVEADRVTALGLGMFGLPLQNPKSVVKMHFEPEPPKVRRRSSLLCYAPFTTAYTHPVRYKHEFTVDGCWRGPWGFHVPPEGRALSFQWWVFLATPKDRIDGEPRQRHLN